MFNADIPLNQVSVGMYLLLGREPPLALPKASRLFCQPERVIAVHRGLMPDEGNFMRHGGVVIRARGPQKRTNRQIGLEMTNDQGHRVLVLFPDDRRLVPAVNLPDVSTLDGATAIVKQGSATSPERPIVDPASGHVHDRGDLSAYRLPAFWRDASVVWSVLPACWVGRIGFHSELLLFEASSGVRSPAPADIKASEALFEADVTIATATLCWEDVTVTQGQHDDKLHQVIDPLPNPLLGPSMRRLLAAFASPDALRSAAVEFLDRRLVQSAAHPAYLAAFVEERASLAAAIAAGNGHAAH